ncbi:MAG: beta-ketoacyl-[acyl-carrier-protein] synthase family protein [Planctomycetota bacterium]
MRAPRSIAVTGIGSVSPLGVGTRAFIEGLRAGRSAVRPFDGDTHNIDVHTLADCPDFDPASVMSHADIKRVPRLIPMALAAAHEALDHARLDLHASQEDVARSCALLLGTGGGGIDFTLDQAQTAYAEGADRLRKQPSLWTITNATHGNLSGELSIRLGARGPSLCVSTGCASSSDAIAHARDLLLSDRPGSPAIAIVIGADAHVRWETLHGMDMLGCITNRRDDPASASRPFDVSRDGFVLGEGAWALVLETHDSARAREALPIGEIIGAGATCDAFHRVRPDPTMRECARAIRHAIEDAAIEPTDVDLVQYHGTATKLNDELETIALRAAFEDHADRLRGSSIKSMIGHPQGACGSASVVAMLGALSHDEPFIPPTINLREQDPACDLDCTPNEAAPIDADRAHVTLVNCLAFGAKNSALLLRTPARR